MAITRINAVSAGSTDGQSATTGAASMTGADGFIAAIASIASAASVSVSDSGGLTWNPLTEIVASLARVRLFWAVGTGGGSHTFTVGNIASSFPSIAVLGVSGLHTSPFDVENGAFEEDGSATIQPGSVTPSQSGSLLVTVVGLLGTADSIDLSYTLEEAIASSGGQHFGIGLAYLIQGAAAASNPTWTMSPANVGIATAIAAFKEASSGSSPSPAAGALALAGKGTSLGFTINMPDEA